jgi:hypothetical protein
MANYQLQNDWVVSVPVVAHDAAGDVVPAPSGDVFSVSADNAASLNVAIGTMSNGNPAIVMNALVQVSPGINVTLSDSAGLEVDTFAVDIVQDVTPTALGVDFTATEHTMQPVPTAPGP